MTTILFIGIGVLLLIIIIVKLAKKNNNENTFKINCSNVHRNIKYKNITVPNKILTKSIDYSNKFKKV